MSRETIDRWIRAWRAGGFAALAPPARQVTPRTDAAVLELAAGLKREKPARTSARILAAGHALVQNLCRGHYDIATDVPDRHRLRIAFDDLAIAI